MWHTTCHRSSESTPAVSLIHMRVQTTQNNGTRPYAYWNCHFDCITNQMNKQCITIYNKTSHVYGHTNWVNSSQFDQHISSMCLLSQKVTFGIGSVWLTGGWHFVLLLCDDLLLQLPSHPLQCLLPHARDPTPGCQQCACPPCCFAAPSHRITSAILTFPSIMHKNNWGLAAADT